MYQARENIRSWTSSGVSEHSQTMTPTPNMSFVGLMLISLCWDWQHMRPTSPSSERSSSPTNPSHVICVDNLVGDWRRALESLRVGWVRKAIGICLAVIAFFYLVPESVVLFSAIVVACSIWI